MDINNLTNKIINGYKISKKEALELVNSSMENLLKSSKRIKESFCGDSFDFCTIINGKSGKCSEDCFYCSQSAYYDCVISEYELLDEQEIIADAKSNYDLGMNRYSVVTSGRRLNNKDIDKLINTYKRIGKEIGIKTCASLGLLEYEDFLKLKNAGVTRYHNNLETSRNYFGKVCTTHTYDEKITSIKQAQKAGLTICSGGIIGLGETMEDRIDLALELRNLKVDSIPINLLNPIKGTPLENNRIIDDEEFYRVCAIFRFIHPKKVIRFAGGRNLLKDMGKKGFETCINGTISGNLLTTYGNKPEDDILMIKGVRSGIK